MVGESLAIIAVILVFAVMLARTGRRGFALLTLPLVSVPVFHLIGWVWPPVGHLIMALDVVGMVVGMIVCIVISRAFRSRRGRFAYLTFCGAFLIALTVAYLLNLY